MKTHEERTLSRRWLAVICSALWIAGCADGSAGVQANADALSDGDSDAQPDAGAQPCASALLRNAYGQEVGEVSFKAQGELIRVRVHAQLPDGGAAEIRGMHIHANDNPANGEGCSADPEQPANTHFVSADGHFSAAGHVHGQHAGDMPALFFTAGGAAAASFMTDRFQLDEIVGRAIIVHELADNYGNIPVGDKPEQYSPNDPAASDLTARTGNAGNRYACGLIE
jgi:superoxide dismutase, Cu-Zn family